jgi:hypothetical protein
MGFWSPSRQKQVPHLQSSLFSGAVRFGKVVKASWSQVGDGLARQSSGFVIERRRE